ncbi:MAG: hypothetical protein WCS96_10000 [Victivallales bacterium]|jgi:hypothetical protein
MIVDLSDLIYFENDGMSGEGKFPMTDFNGRHKPHTTLTGDFNISIPPCNPDTLIFFAAYP